MDETALLVTCEHGGNAVPRSYRHLFPASSRTVLASHRGFDAGALTVARQLAARLGAPLLYSQTTRLLVDLNRSPRHPRLLSEFTRQLNAAARCELLAAHYLPYRSAVESAARMALEGGAAIVLHVSAHSFTPSLDGRPRDADVGLLYDPGRSAEVAWAAAWRSALRDALPAWKIRRNYPYRGVADGLTTDLRRRLPADRYAGVELEINQRRVDGPDWLPHVARIGDALALSLKTLRVPEGGVSREGGRPAAGEARGVAIASSDTDRRR